MEDEAEGASENKPSSGKKKLPDPSPYLTPDSGLERLSSDEEEVQHRAFLLYAMQDDGRRSGRAAMKAVGKSEATARLWKARFGWDQRLVKYGETAQARACQMYRTMYFAHHQLREHAAVAHKMSVPLLTTSAPPDPKTGRGEETRANERQLQETLPISQREKVLAFQKQSLDMIQTLITAYVLRVKEKGLDAAGLKASDIPKLLAQHADLAERMGILDPQVTPGVAALEPSYRVQLAQSKANGDVLSAMAEDVEELQIVFAQLKEKRRVAEEVARRQAELEQREQSEASGSEAAAK